jgi:membrane protease YdiL (CAAX protease family)
VNGRLVVWLLIVLILAALAYAPAPPPSNDIAYRWESSVLTFVQEGVFVGIVFLLSRGLDRRSLLGLRRPKSWWRATGIAVLVFVATFVVSAIVASFGNPREEQGLIPEHFDSHRALQFAAFAVAVTTLAPIGEEFLFRGLGYGLLEPFGRRVAVVGVGLAFASIHGLVAGFPIIATFGIGLAYLRARTGSIYPCILLHAAFNALSLAIGVAAS